MRGISFLKLLHSPHTAGVTPPNILPVLWTIARAAASVTAGEDVVYTLTADRQGNAATAMSLIFKVPPSVGADLITATSANFSTTFQAAVEAAALVTTGASYRLVAPNFFIVDFDATWAGTLVITRTSLALQDQATDLLTGIEIYNQSTGTLSVAAVSVTVAKIVATAVIPTNSTAPTLTKQAPSTQSVISVNNGVWANTPTDYQYQWQSLASAVPASFSDNFNRTNGPLTSDPNWTLAAGTAANLAIQFSSSVSTVGDAGATVALCPDIADQDQYVQIKVNSTNNSRAKLILKWVDINNYIYFSLAAGPRVYVVVGGTPTLRITVATLQSAAGDIFNVECKANVVTLRKNGVVLSTPYTLTGAEVGAGKPSVGTRAGIGTYTNGGSGYLDDFVNGGFTAGSGVATDIPAATSQGYLPAVGDIGAQLRCGVSAGNSAGYSAYVYSAYSDEVTELEPVTPIPVNTEVPILTDTTPTVGQTLSCGPGTWDNAVTYEFVWQLNSVDITGPAETASTYVVRAGDVGLPLRCGVRATNLAGTSAYVYSAQSSNVAAAAGTLTDVLLSNSYVAVSAAADVVVGTFSSAGVGTVASSAFLTGGDAGGRFKLVGNVLKVAAVAPDFEGPLSATDSPNGPPGALFGYGLDAYLVSLRFTGGAAETVDKTFAIRPIYSKVQPTGDETNTTTTITDYTTVNSTVGGSSPKPDNRTVILDPNACIGYADNRATGFCIIDRSNFTWEGHRRFCGFRGNACMWRRGYNQIFRNLQFAVANDQQGFTLDNRDSFQCDNSGSPRGDVIFENCSFFWSVDEICTLISANGPYARKIRFHRCYFFGALFQAGHSEGDHSNGPMIWAWYNNVVFDKCVFIGSQQRSPYAMGYGVLVQNCIISWRGAASTQTGTSFGHADNPASTTVAICRGNLFQQEYRQADGSINPTVRKNAIRISGPSGGVIGGGNPATVGGDNRTGIPTQVLIPGAASRYANQYIDAVRNLFAPDPLIPSATTLNFHSTTASMANVSTDETNPPFQCDDYDLMPTGTEAEIRALFADVMNYVGCRERIAGVYTPGDLALSKAAYDDITNWRATGYGTHPHGGYPLGPPPAAYVPSNITYVLADAYSVPGAGGAVPTSTGVLPVLSDTTPAELQTITVTSPGGWNGSPTFYEYSWQKDGVAISGPAETTSSYSVRVGDATHTLRCGVRANNEFGPAAAYVYSAATSAVSAAPASQTAETTSLLRFITSYGGTNTSYILGCYCRHTKTGEPPATGSVARPDAEFQEIHNITGKYPAMLNLGYYPIDCFPSPIDPVTGIRLGDGPSGGDVPTGATRNAEIIARFKRHYDAGGICSMFFITANPINGDMRWISPGNYSTGVGGASDMTGNPVGNCVTGGSVNAKYNAWLDNLAAFFKACRGTDGKLIPIIFRLFPEVNGNGVDSGSRWFWWQGPSSETMNSRSAKFKALWTYTVNYLRVTKGVTNMLTNLNFQPGISQTNAAKWYDSTTVDMVSTDVYVSMANGGGGPASEATNIAAIRGACSGKPFFIQEMGCGQATTGGRGPSYKAVVDVEDVWRRVNTQMKASSPDMRFAWAVGYWGREYTSYANPPNHDTEVPDTSGGWSPRTINSTLSKTGLTAQVNDAACITLDKIPALIAANAGPYNFP